MAQTINRIELQLQPDGRLRAVAEPSEGPPLVAWGYAHELPAVSGSGDSFGRSRVDLDAYVRGLLAPLVGDADLSAVPIDYEPALRVAQPQEQPAKR